MNLELENLPNLRALLEGSHVHSDNLEKLLEYWIQNRQPIVQAICQAGRFLDIGCANGFLLVCLMRWNDFQITPYGIDIDEHSIEAARVLLPEYPNHFVQVPLEHFFVPSNFGFPEDFDYVYWCVWDGLDFHEPLCQTFAENAFGAARAGGRVILGFYDTDHECVKRQLEWLVDRFGTYSAILKLDVVFAWWDCGLRVETDR